MSAKNTPKKQPNAKPEAKATPDQTLIKPGIASLIQNSGGLPAGWKWVKVAEIGKIETGSTPSKQDSNFYADEFPFYKPTDLEAGYNVRISRDNLSASGLKEARFLPIDSILVTCIGATIGKTGIIRRAGACNQQINAIVPSKDYNPNFIYYQAVAPIFQKSIKDNAAATTLPILNKSKFQNLEMVHCSLSEQHAIVSKIEELFSELDKGKQQLETAKQQLKIYRQAVLKWAFEGKLSELGRVGLKDDRITGLHNQKEILQSTNPKNPNSDSELPEGWRINDLKSITESIQYGFTDSSSKEPIGPKFLRITDIQDNKVDWNDVPYCSIDSELKKKYLLRGGDLVFARTGATVGKSFLIKGEIPDAVFASYLIRVRVNMEMNEKYLSYYFNSPNYWTQITEGQVGTGQPNVNGTKLGQLKIVIAPLKEQHVIVQEIESRLSVCDKVEETINQSLAQAETLRQSILKKAFEGKLIS